MSIQTILRRVIGAVGADELEKCPHHLIFRRSRDWPRSSRAKHDGGRPVSLGANGFGVTLKFHPQIEAIFDKVDVVAALFRQFCKSPASSCGNTPEPLTMAQGPRFVSSPGLRLKNSGKRSSRKACLVRPRKAPGALRNRFVKVALRVALILVA